MATFSIYVDRKFTWDELASLVCNGLTGEQLKAYNEYASHVTTLFIQTPFRVPDQYIKLEVKNTPGMKTKYTGYSNPINYGLKLLDIRDIIPEILKSTAPEDSYQLRSVSPVRTASLQMIRYYWEQTHNGNAAPTELLSTGDNYATSLIEKVTITPTPTPVPVIPPVATQPLPTTGGITEADVRAIVSQEINLTIAKLVAAISNATNSN